MALSLKQSRFDDPIDLDDLRCELGSCHSDRNNFPLEECQLVGHIKPPIVERMN